MDHFVYNLLFNMAKHQKKGSHRTHCTDFEMGEYYELIEWKTEWTPKEESNLTVQVSDEDDEHKKFKKMYWDKVLQWKPIESQLWNSLTPEEQSDTRRIILSSQTKNQKLIEDVRTRTNKTLAESEEMIDLIFSNNCNSYILILI